MSAPDHHPPRTRVVFDGADVRAADRLIDRFGTVAARAIPEAPADSRTIGRLIALAKAANAVIAAGGSRDGLRVDRLARQASYHSGNHIFEHLDGVWVRQWAALTIRLLMSTGGPLLAEQLVTAAVPVGRDSRRAGFDNRSGVPKVKPLMRLYLAGADRHLVSWQIPLLSATSCDRTAVDADIERIERYEVEFGHTLPASLDDHLRLALSERRALLDIVQTLAADHPEALREALLDPAMIAQDAFSPVVIVPALAYGSPHVPGEDHSQLVMPGDDPAVLAALAEAGLTGIAEMHVTPHRAPSRALTLDRGVAANWGLTAPAWNTSFQVLGDDELLRVDSSGFGATARLWRVFGMRPDDQRAAAAAERAAETWPRTCVTRADAAAPPGRAYPKAAAHRRTMMALGAVADAAHVTAERERRMAPR